MARVSGDLMHRDTGFWLVALAASIAFGNGLLMLLAPAQFAGPAYALIQPYLQAYAVGLVATGGALGAFAVARRRPHAVLAGLVALALVPLWLSFARAGVVTGVVTLGIQIAAAALAATSLLPRLGIGRPTLGAVALIQIMQAAAMVALPQQFANPGLYGGFGTLLWVFAPSFAVAGVGLLVSRRRRLVVAFGGLAVANFAALAVTFTGTRIWTGVLNYGAMVTLVLLAISGVPARATAARLLFGAAAGIAFLDLARWAAVFLGLGQLAPDAAVVRPVGTVGLGLLGAIGLWSVSARPRPRVRGIAGIIALAVVALAGAAAPAATTEGSIIRDLGPATLDLRPSATTLLLLAMSAVAVGGPLAFARNGPKVVALVAAAMVCAIAGANLFAYVIDEPFLFSVFGIATLRLHTALALLFLSAGVLFVSVPAIVAASLVGRLAVGFGAILSLVALEAFISISSTTRLIELFANDPTGAAREGRAATAASSGLLVVIGCAMLAIAYAVTRSIAAPFRQLSHAMRSFADGRRDARVAIGGTDEIARAGAAFNSMARELQRAHEDLEGLALHDAHTGLPNRRLLGDRLDQALRQTARDHAGVAVLVLDLDSFKQINDTRGHSAGDEVLSAVAARLRDLVRPADTVARLGGDEFAIVLPGADGPAARTVADRIRVEIRRPIDAAGAPVTIRASIGIALCPADGTTPAALLATADSRMYADKPGFVPVA